MNRRDSSATLQQWSWCISTKHEGKQFSIQLHPIHIFNVERYEIVYWTVLCYHLYLISMLFADLLSLHLLPFSMLFICVHLAADACLSWSFPSITEQHVCPHRLPQRWMQYWLKNHWPDQALVKNSLHTNCISNSAILHNNYISLPSLFYFFYFFNFLTFFWWIRTVTKQHTCEEKMVSQRKP